jgi:RNA-directed DNA polymerase
LSVWITDRKGQKRALGLYQVAKTVIERHIKVRADANPYDPQYTEYFEKRRCFAWRTYSVGKPRAFSAGMG